LRYFLRISFEVGGSMGKAYTSGWVQP
jgi:hypothetical protein